VSALRLYALSGLSFSGKSTLAAELGRTTGAAIVSYDELFVSLPRPAGIEGLAEWQLLVDEVHERARAELAAGRSVIVDTLNEDLVDRDELRAIADEHGAETVVVYLDTPLDVIAERRRQNEESGERGTTRDDNFAFVLAKFEPPRPHERAIRVTPGDGIDDVVARIEVLA
jgi:predicted kinase